MHASRLALASDQEILLDFHAFVASKPAKEKYNFNDPYGCAFAQYLQHCGVPYVDVSKNNFRFRETNRFYLQNRALPPALQDCKILSHGRFAVQNLGFSHKTFGDLRRDLAVHLGLEKRASFGDTICAVLSSFWVPATVPS